MNASRNSANYAVEGGTFTKVVQDVDRGISFFQKLWDGAIELPAEAFVAPGPGCRHPGDEVAAAHACSLRPDYQCMNQEKMPQRSRGKGGKNFTRSKGRGSSQRNGGHTASDQAM